VRAQDVKEPSACKNSNENSKNDDREAGTGFSYHKVQIKKLRGFSNNGTD
jgi:hypothetical protein